MNTAWAITPGGAFVPAPKVTDTSRIRGLRGICDPAKRRVWSPAEHLIDALKGVGILFAGMTDAVERKQADSFTGKTGYVITAPTFLALCSTAPSDTDTAASITDLTYTGYARLSFAATDFNAASTASGISTTTAPVAQKTFGAVTGGSGTAVGWARCTTVTVGGAGDALMIGTLTSVTFSVTQTPPTVAAGALVETWD